jgi:hypothetical protein
MANNYVVKDGNGNLQTFVSFDTGGGIQLAESCPHDGTNKMKTLFDLDTSGSTHEWNLGVGLRISASGGSIEAKGQKAMASSIPVAIASDQAAFPVSQSGTWTVTQSGTWTVATNADTAIGGTTAPSKGLLVLGKTNDATPQYQPLPEGAGGRSVIIEGYSGGTAVPVSGTFWQATQPVSGTVTANQGGSNWTANVTQWNGTTVDTNSGTKSAGTLRVVLATDQPQLTNALKVDPSGVTSPVSGTVTANQGTAAGLSSAWPVQVTDKTNTMPTMDAVGRAGYVYVTDGTHTQPTGDASARPIYITCVPVTSGGLTTYRVLWPGNTTGVNIKASAGQVYGWYLYNNASSIRVVKLYNKATAPTVGTDTPTQTIVLPANGGANVFSDIGFAFSSGIGIGVTTGIADNDTGAPSANDVVANLFYN